MSWMDDHDQPSYRADQMWHWLYKELTTDIEAITTLPEDLRHTAKEFFNLASLTPVQSLSSSDDRTEKTLFQLDEGDEYVEAVLMHYSRQRRTACISTQSGCAMGCVFCATGQMGFRRHLSAGEIIEQVLHFERKLRAKSQRLTKVVVMGMGEPLHNYEATLEALDRLNDHDGFNFGARRTTISTVGLVPAIERYTREDRPYNLAVSLHAVDDDLRASMLPINKRYPLKELRAACQRYVNQSGRRLTFEWALVRDVNDNIDHAEALAKWINNMLCHVNLIPLNPTQGYPGEPTPTERANAFKERLQKHGISCTIRMRRGIDINAGCGQLATEVEAGAR